MTPKQVADYLVANRRQLRTRKGRECPVCGHKDSYCIRLDDGTAALCPKADGAGAVRKYGEYGHLYLIGADFTGKDVNLLPPVKKQRDRTDAELHTVWAPRARHWWKDSAMQTDRLAMNLGVASWALNELYCGWDGKAWTFPERNGDGLILGVSRRFEDGGKRFATGGRRGLTYSDTWDGNPGPVLIVEGQSDTAAGITMGIAAIGRPSNTGGSVMLVKLLTKHKERKIIVIGERDKKPDGRYPGLEGARSVCQSLTRHLGQRVSCRLLPGDAKDLRAWWRATGSSIGDAFAVGKELLRQMGYRP